MPVTPTFPGIYIEEIKSSAHTITAAPTSIAVFVGYTHPFKTKRFRTPVQLFSFSDYEREFGGFFTSAAFAAAGATSRFGSLAHAVNQFFLNGGSNCYVIGLEISDPSTSPPGFILGGTAILDEIQFEAIEPTDAVPMTVSIRIPVDVTSPPGGSPTADITIAYGSQIETFRQLNLTAAPVPGKPLSLDQQRFIGSVNGLSALIRVSPVPPKAPESLDFGTTFHATPSPIPLSTSPSVTTNPFEEPTFNAQFLAAFEGVFQADSDLDKLPIFNLLVLPGVSDVGILSTALAFCDRKRAFLIMDPPPSDDPQWPTLMVGIIEGTALPPAKPIPKEKNGALYFPYIKAPDPASGNNIEVPPSGTVAGIFARTDLNRGVWKAPAGLETTILNTTGVVDRGRMTDQRQGVLNPFGVNVLRDFPGIGTVIWGARTLVTLSEEQWRYVPVRRMALFLEQTLYNNLGWVVFEPNDDPLWAAIRTSIEAFMLGLFRQGAFQGITPSQAFQVKCDNQTTTQADIDNGIVNIVVAFAPLKPAEFVIIKIAQLAGQTQTS